MKKSIIIFALILSNIYLYSIKVEFIIDNSVYAYNGENSAHWEETRTTITYFENLLQPTLHISPNQAVHFKFGIGLLIPFDQESKILNYYPFVQTKLIFDKLQLTLGSLDGEHNFPAPILDPLVTITPQVRVISSSRIPIDYENFPVTGLFSHGKYEYGLALGWNTIGTGELYMNWQLADTTNHRERFDVGLIHTFDTLAVPIYVGLHYWHNGGHENPHPVWITENYVAAVGLRNKNFDILYIASYFLPDRDSHPEQNVFGEALYFTYSLHLKKWILQAELFISDELFADNHRFVSIEGGAFYRVPVYFGINIFREFEIHETTKLSIGFKNGTFLPYANQAYDGKDFRYDQMLKIDFKYIFDLTKKEKDVLHTDTNTYE